MSKERFKLIVDVHLLLIRDGKIVLLKRANTGYEAGKYGLIAGHADGDETATEAMVREAREEAGIEIEVEKFLTFKETYFYYDPADLAWQNYSFFFICKPLSFELSEDNQVEFDEAYKPEWIELSKLKKDDFSYPADEIFQLI